MKLQHYALMACLTVGALGAGGTAAFELDQRRHLSIVGSSTAFPIISAVAERFAHGTSNLSPAVEATGTGGGFKLFCAGIGLQTPDLSMASRRMKPSERARCSENGVTDIVELKIGYDGIVLANAAQAPQFVLTQRDIYLALARQVPDPAQPAQLIDNPYHNWQQINPNLPDQEIMVYGPPPTSGTRDKLVELLFEPNCHGNPALQAVYARDADAFRQLCNGLREDGAYIEAGENDSRLVRKLVAEPKALGIFGYNFVERNRGRLHAASIDGVGAEFAAIESGDYPVSRPLFLYIKRAHQRAVVGLQPFLNALIADNASGDEGYLTEKGLIPLRPDERAQWYASAQLSPVADD